MKRDMDLVREILLYAEQHATPSRPCSVKIEGHSGEEISYHLGLMRDAGLIDARTPGGPIWAVLGLTWAGHEFLDAARDDSRWSKAKKTLADKAGSVSFEVVKAVLVELAKNAAMSALGVSVSA